MMRYSDGSQPVPDFSSKKNWYDHHVFYSNGKGPLKEISYSSEYIKIRDIHQSLGINTSVKTQTGRKRAANSEDRGASAASLDKQGKWATQSRNGAYANASVPWDAVRVLAGFPPEAGRYNLRRNLRIPSKALLVQTFPWLEIAREQMQNDLDMAGTNFLDLIEYLRIVVLQDAAVLMDMDEYAGHPVFDLNVCYCFLIIFRYSIRMSIYPFNQIFSLPCVTLRLQKALS